MKSLGTGVTKSIDPAESGNNRRGKSGNAFCSQDMSIKKIIFLKKSKPIFRTRFLGNQKKLYMLAYFLKAGIG